MNENDRPDAADGGVAELEAQIARVRAAQAQFAAYTQEQVDAVFKAAAIAADKARIPLAKLAASETGMGIVEDKVIKNHYAAEYIYNTYKDTKTCGVVEEDEAAGIMKVAEPIGVIGAVIPTTNPTSTAIFKTLLAPTRAPRTARWRRRKSSLTRRLRQVRPKGSSRASRRRACPRRTCS